jgi:hypothetical protein
VIINMTITFSDGYVHTAPVAKENQETIFRDLKENGVTTKSNTIRGTGTWYPFHSIVKLDWEIIR